MTPSKSPVQALQDLGMTPEARISVFGDVIWIDIPGFAVAVFAGPQNPNCICWGGDHRTPGCPQHRDLAGGEVA